MESTQNQARSSVETNIQTLLDAEADPKPLTDLPLHCLLSAGLSNQQKLIDKLCTQFLPSITEEPAKRELQALVDDNKRLTDSLSIQSHYRAKKDLGLDILTTSLITPIYRAPENGAHSITDAAAKLVPTFSGDLNSGPELDQVLEDFLSLAYKISAQNNLSYKTCCSMLQRKLTGTAKLLLASWLESQNISEETLELPMLATFLEAKFALYSSPKAANLTLANLPKLQNNQYHSQVGKISRLARLACRLIEDQQQRQLLQTSKALETFKLSLSDKDRTYLLNQDRINLEENRPSLTLHKAAQLLTNRFVEEQQTEGSQQGMSFVDRVQEHQVMAMQAQRKPKNRGNQNHLNTANQVNNQGSTYEHFNQHQATNDVKRTNFQYRGRSGRTRPPWRGTGRPEHKMRGQYQNQYQNNEGGIRNRGRGRGRDNRGRIERTQRKPFVTFAMVNVAEGACLLCASQSCHFRSEKCPYYKRSELFPNPCRNCNKGGHSHRSCLQKRGNKNSKQANISNENWKYSGFENQAPGYTGDDNEDSDIEDFNDFMSQINLN